MVVGLGSVGSVESEGGSGVGGAASPVVLGEASGVGSVTTAGPEGATTVTSAISVPPEHAAVPSAVATSTATAAVRTPGCRVLIPRAPPSRSGSSAGGILRTVGAVINTTPSETELLDVSGPDRAVRREGVRRSASHTIRSGP